jgi:hypothetical protein
MAQVKRCMHGCMESQVINESEDQRWLYKDVVEDGSHDS